MAPRTSTAIRPFLLVAALALAACGGSDDAPTAADVAASPEQAIASASDAVADAVSDPPDVQAGGGGEACEQIASIDDAFTALGDAPVTQEIVDSMRALESSAPGEVGAAAGTLADGFERIIGIDPTDIEQAEELAAVVADPEFISASETITTYAAEECDLNLEG